MQALTNMSVGHFESYEQEAYTRPWRCTLSVPYVHKASAHTNEHYVRDAKHRVLRDKGTFFMGAAALLAVLL